MRVLMQIQIPHEPFNTFLREGSVGQKMGRLLEETRPESIYFTEVDGHRGDVAVYQLAKESELTKVCEPWFLTFNADCRTGLAMSPEDLKNANIDDLGKRWR